MIVARVLASRLRLWRNSVLSPGARRGRIARGRSPLAVIVILLAMGLVAHAGFLALFRSLAAAGATPSELAIALGLAFDASALALIVLGLDATVATLLLDPDLELLRRAPVRPAALLALKLFDSIPRTAAPLVTIAIPAALAWAETGRAGAAAWSAIPAALAALWVIATGLGVALALPLLGAIPARRAREALGLIATLVLTGVWLANALWLPRLAAGGAEPIDEARAMIAAAERGPLTPGRAVANALVEFARPEPGAAPARTSGALPAAALALGAAGLAAWSASRFLRRALEAVAAPVRGTIGTRRRPGTGAARRALALTVIGRDAKLFTRDWTVVADVVTAAILWMLLPMLARDLLAAGGRAMASVMLASLAVGLGYEVAARSVPFERRAATWMQLAPVAPGRWIFAKLLSASALSLPLLLAAWLSVGWALGLPAADRLAALDVGLGAFTLATGLGVWAGTRFGDPRWTNPRGMLTLGGRLVASALMLAQVALWSLIALALPGMLSPTACLIGDLVLLPGAALLSLLPIRSAARRIVRLGWYG